MSNRVNVRRPGQRVRHESRWGRRVGAVQRRPRPVRGKRLARDEAPPCPSCGAIQRADFGVFGMRMVGRNHKLTCRLRAIRLLKQIFGET